jgi:hypothetical protein
MNRNWIPWIVLLVLLLGAGALGYSLLREVQQTTQPIVDLRDNVATQVAQLLHPTPTVIPDPVTIVREVRALARLETIHYTVEKVITAEIGQGPFEFLVGDRLLLVAHGKVIAGVDLAKIGPNDVWLDSAGRVYMILPEPEIFVATLDNDKSYVYQRETGLFTKGDVNLESTARLAAEEAMLEAALEDGILEQARINAESYLYRMMRALDFQDLIFAEEGDRP